MNTFPIDEKIQSWLDSLPSSVPLRAVTLGSSSSEGVRLRAMIADSGLPSDSLITAMLWVRVGIIEPAHEIVRFGSRTIEQVCRPSVVARGSDGAHRLDRMGEPLATRLTDRPELLSTPIALAPQLGCLNQRE